MNRALCVILFAVYLPSLLPAQESITFTADKDTLGNLKYMALVQCYRGNKLPYLDLGKLALVAMRRGDRPFADSVAKDYKIHYLDSLNDFEVLQKENIRFITNFIFLIQPRDRFFNFFFANGVAAEKLADARPGYAHVLINYIITEYEINRYLYSKGKAITDNPRWSQIYERIVSEYGKGYADDLVEKAKMPFYRSISNWTEVSRLFDKKIRTTTLKPGSKCWAEPILDDSWEINMNAWDVFLHCKNRKALKRALAWSSLSIGLCIDTAEKVQLLDTKANLLYKLGKVRQAMAFERIAFNSSKGGEDYKTNLVKMKDGVPTWPQN